MLKGVTKEGVKIFTMKEGVDYKNRNLQGYLYKDMYDRKGKLYYYSRCFYTVNKVFKQEYCYNKIIRRVDYRDNDGVKWYKEYNDNGFEIYIKSKIENKYHKFDETKGTIVTMTNDIVSKESVYNIKDRYVIDGVDYEDRFLLENNDLLNWFIANLTTEEILKKISRYGDVNLLHKIVELLDDEIYEGENND